MTHDERGLDEQIVSKAAEVTLSSQLDSAEKIDVDIKTNLSEIIQGQVDSVEISGQGLVMQKDIRVQEMQLHTDSVDINPLSALFGQIELNQPIDATGRVVLLEADLNRTLNSDYVRSKMESYELNVDGQIVTLEMQQMELRLPMGNTMVFSAKTLLTEKGKTRQLGFTATARPRTRTQPVLLEGFHCHDGQSISLELAVALLEKMKEIVNLPYLEMEQMAFRVQEMEVQPGSITLQVQAHVKQLPSE